MDLALELKQTQRLSPQMIQTMEILQMDTVELQEYVEKALLENPVLEHEPAAETAPDAELWSKLRWLEAGDRQNRGYRDDDSHDWLSNVPAPAEESLDQYLREQLPMERLSPELRQAVECVLTGLNGNGYLEESDEALSRRCGQPVETIARAVELVQSLEPAGVGARGLSQCLALQLKRRGETGLPLTIVTHHLEDMAHSHYHQIAKATGADRVRIQEACQLIRELDPKPGAPFSGGNTPGYIVPDLLVREVDGQLEAVPCDWNIPTLRISGYYQQLMSETDEPQVRSYLTEKLNQATWLIQGIQRRQTTLLRCAQVMVRRQEDFFRRGAGFLRPMVLADVAAELAIHESTVSRAIRGKYLQCAAGIFPLSHFFVRGLSAPEGEAVSADAAKAMIRRLVGQEDPRHPLSDQKISQELARQKVVLSRRTVAKYREEMGLPPAAGRRVI